MIYNIPCNCQKKLTENGRKVIRIIHMDHWHSRADNKQEAIQQ